MIVTSLAAFGYPLSTYNPPLPSVTPVPVTTSPTLNGVFPVLTFEFTPADLITGEPTLPAKNNEPSVALYGKGGLGHTASDVKGTLYNAYAGNGPGNAILASFSGFRPFRIRNTGISSTGQAVAKTATRIGLYLTQTAQANWDAITGGSSPSSPAADFTYFKNLSTAVYADTVDFSQFVGVPVSQQSIITSVPNGLFLFGPKNPELDCNQYFLGTNDPSPAGIPKFTFINQKLLNGVPLVTDPALIGRYWFMNENSGTLANQIFRIYSDKNYIAVEAGGATPYRAIGCCTKDSIASTPVGTKVVDLTVQYRVT